MPDPFQDPSWQRRICITLGTDPEGKREIPFAIGVLADLSGMPEKPLPRLRDRRFVRVDTSNFDGVLAAYAPHLTLSVTNRLSDDPNAAQIKTDLAFRELGDFAPERIARQIRPLHDLLDLRNHLADLRTRLVAKEGLDEMLQNALRDTEKLDLLRAEIDPELNAVNSSSPQPAPYRPAAPVSPVRHEIQAELPEKGVWSRGAGAQKSSFFDQLVDAFQETAPQRQEATKTSLTEFISDVLIGGTTLGSNIENTLCARIAEIDRLLSMQIGEVLHHPALMKLESTWRGLHFLVSRTRKAQGVQIWTLNITKKELCQQYANERVRYGSPVGRKVLAQPADTPGATPFGLLISDFTFGAESEDVYILQHMGRLGAAAHVPFVASADWRLFGHSNFKEVAETTLLRQIFDTERYTLWRHLGDRPESRYIGLVLPQVLLRSPYEGHPSGEKFVCEETVDMDNSKLLWGSAAWAFAARQASDFDRYGWFGAERTPDDLGELTDLPRLAFRTDDGDVAWLGPVEVALSDTCYLELRSLGLIPICQIADTNRATFFETWSLHKPNIVSDTDEGRAYVAVGLDCILCVSRIAHYLRSILQTERQRFSSVQHCEEYLRNWITPYVVPEYARGSSFEAAFPLLAAEVHIALGPEPARPSFLQASLLPKQVAGTAPHPVEISIPIALPWSLASSPGQPDDTLERNEGAAMVVARLPHSNGSPSGRDRFIHRTFAAEACIANRKLDIAILILEDLVQQIDRYSLYQWESPELITRVWDLLRRCYLLNAGVAGADEQSTELLRKICRLDPSRVIE